MRNARLASLSVLVIVSSAPALVWGQARPAAVTAGQSLRTAWGDPDLQGIWTNSTITPLQRPKDLAGKEFFTAEEAARFERQTAENRIDRPPRPGDPGTYNQLWFDQGTKVVGTRRTSQIIDPADGRIPPMTSEGRKRADVFARTIGVGAPDSYESLDQWDRCLTRGMPMMPGPYNNNYQILQTPGYVVILREMIHEVRIIPTNGGPHLGQQVRQLMGDSRGRWDRNALIVETTNFSNKTEGALGAYDYRGPGETTRMIERLTRVDADTIEYEYTIDDPATFTKPWTAALHMMKSQENLYEYACHEGNYAIVNILKGARVQERAGR